MFYSYWTESMIRSHIMARHGKEPLNYHYYVTEYPDVHAAAIRIFGSWENAIEACGIDYKTIRKYQRWSKARVISTIQELLGKGEVLSSQHVQNHHKALYMAAVKRFKNWGTALTAAGIDYKNIRQRRKMTPEEIKREILELNRRKEDLAYPHMREKYQYLLAAGMKKLGAGSWAEARRKCGITTNFRKPH
jgi:5,10-methylene-tetrahydrofolate dehydrogenase/methenyl tetrahydrofolate cyclohydrolase